MIRELMKGWVNMKKIIVLCFIMFVLILPNTIFANANSDINDPDHNWEEYSTSYDLIEVGTHEYSYWRNLFRHTRTCHISHKLKTTVYYCADHDHTKSETELVEIIHSGNHD